MLQTVLLFPKKRKNAKNSFTVPQRHCPPPQLTPAHKPFAQAVQWLHQRCQPRLRILSSTHLLIYSSTHSLSAVPAIPRDFDNSRPSTRISPSGPLRACGLCLRPSPIRLRRIEAATRTAITLWPSPFQSRFSAGRLCNPPVSLPASHRRAPISAPPKPLRFSPPACRPPPSPPARPAASEPC